MSPEKATTGNGEEAAKDPGNTAEDTVRNDQVNAAAKEEESPAATDPVRIPETKAQGKAKGKAKEEIKQELKEEIKQELKQEIVQEMRQEAQPSPPPAGSTRKTLAELMRVDLRRRRRFR